MALPLALVHGHASGLVSARVVALGSQANFEPIPKLETITSICPVSAKADIWCDSMRWGPVPVPIPVKNLFCGSRGT